MTMPDGYELIKPGDWRNLRTRVNLPGLAFAWLPWGLVIRVPNVQIGLTREEVVKLMEFLQEHIKDEEDVKK